MITVAEVIVEIIVNQDNRHKPTASKPMMTAYWKFFKGVYLQNPCDFIPIHVRYPTACDTLTEQQKIYGIFFKGRIKRLKSRNFSKNLWLNKLTAVEELFGPDP